MSILKWKNYEVKHNPIGKGVQGQVYEGYDPINKRKVAIKRLSNIENAKREVYVMQNYGNHKFLPKYYDFFMLNDEAYIVMELIRGNTFKGKTQIYAQQTALQITLNILEGLKHLHNKGILHLDLKLNNIMKKESQLNTVKIIDFGSAKLKDKEGLSSSSRMKNNIAPPEQRKKQQVTDDSTDLYRVAVICVYLLTGHSPLFNKDTQSHTCILKNKELQHILNKAMHPDREKRYRSAQEMIKVLKVFI